MMSSWTFVCKAATTAAVYGGSSGVVMSAGLHAMSYPGSSKPDSSSLSFLATADVFELLGLDMRVLNIRLYPNDQRAVCLLGSSAMWTRTETGPDGIAKKYDSRTIALGVSLDALIARCGEDAIRARQIYCLQQKDAGFTTEGSASKTSFSIEKDQYGSVTDDISASKSATKTCNGDASFVELIFYSSLLKICFWSMEFESRYY